MQRLATRLIAIAALVLLAGCVATAPTKIAATGVKATAKTAKVGAKAAIKTGQALTPDGDADEKEEKR